MTERTMTKTLLAIRHVAFEDLGGFEDPLTQAGFVVRYADMGIDNIADLGDPDLLAVLGGPIGVYEDDLYPWLRDEIAYIADRLKTQRPILGICLGAQLMARALGAPVYPGPAKEIGWKPLRLTKEGEHLLAPFAGHPVLHWHGDTFDLPEGATGSGIDGCLPSSGLFAWSLRSCVPVPSRGPYSGFRSGSLIGHACEIAGSAGVSVTGLRADTERLAQAAPESGPRGIAQLVGAIAMDRLTLFGLFAVTAMLLTYALERRSPWFILCFAFCCVMGSAYGFLQGAWPFGLVEAVWAIVAGLRWWHASRTNRYPP